MMAGRRHEGENASALDVVVAGGGPVGLMLACELRLAGVRCAVLERLIEPDETPKANGLVGQVVEVLDHRGLLESFSAGAPFVGPVPFFQFGALPLDLRRLDMSPLHVLPLPQPRLERLLEERARELGAEVWRGHELTGFSQDEDAVTAEVACPEGAYQLRSRYLVGSDGAHSTVRKRAGIGFPGTTGDHVSRIGDVVLPESAVVPETGELEVSGLGRLRPGFTRTENGVFAFASFTPGVHRVSAMEWGQPPVDREAPVTTGELRESVRRVLGADLPMGEARWLSRTSGNSRQAESYHSGRVFLVGDAAHVFSGAGGPALNLGLQDAVNLGWKLAAEIGEWAPPGLLDTYHAERHPVGSRVLAHTRAQSALMAPGDEVTALREVFGELLEQERTLRSIAEMLHGSDVRYDTCVDEVEHVLVGRFAPDLPLATAEGKKTRVGELVRGARPVLLDLAGRTDLLAAAEGWRDRVDVVSARCEGQAVPAGALLLRPDGYVAWVAPDDGGRDRDGLLRALATWFGIASDGSRREVRQTGALKRIPCAPPGR